MRIAVSIIIGIIFAQLINRWWGFLIGGSVGFLFLWIRELKKEQTQLKQSLHQLTLKISSLESGNRVDAPPQAVTEEPKNVPIPSYIQQPVFKEERPAVEETRPSSPLHPTPLPITQKQPEQELLPELWKLYQSYLGNRNPIVVVGVIVLLFGIAFFLKLAINEGYLSFPIEARFILVAIAAMFLFIWGRSLRTRRPDMANTLQGCAIGAWYITAFIAYRFFNLIPSEITFAIFVILAVGCAVLAVFENAVVLAFVGTLGGFLAPILASKGGGSHVALFSFYLLLNLGILYLAWAKSWKILSALGFIFTFLVGLAWGLKYYVPEYFASTEPFLIAFFLIYFATPFILSKRHKINYQGFLEGLTVFGTPLITLALQHPLTAHYKYGMAISCFVLAVLYLASSRFWTVEKDGALREIYRCFGYLFLALSAPYALEAPATGTMWSILGLAYYWSGQKRKVTWETALGTFVLMASGISLVLDYTQFKNTKPILNEFCIRAAFLSIASLLAAFVGDRNRSAHPSELFPTAAGLLFGWGLLWWMGAGLREIIQHVDKKYFGQVTLLFFTCSSTLGLVAAEFLKWPRIYFPIRMLPYCLPVLLLFAHQHPFENFGQLIWTFALIAAYFQVYRDDKERAQDTLKRHLVMFFTVTVLCIWEITHHIRVYIESGLWHYCAHALILSALLGIIIFLSTRSLWPVLAQPKLYLSLIGTGLSLLLLLWCLASISENGDAWPFIYIPLLNPLEITELLALASVFIWHNHIRSTTKKLPHLLSNKQVFVLLLGISFIGFNAMVARMVHWWGGVPYKQSELWSSGTFQAALSIMWGLLALTLIVIASRRKDRPVWIGGAALMAAVVAKLFLVDLSQTGTVARIVSFLGIGGLMVLIGYVSPLPPDKKDATPPSP